jgi:hypothetical protein
VMSPLNTLHKLVEFLNLLSLGERFAVYTFGVEEMPVIVIPNEAGWIWGGVGEGSPRSDSVCGVGSASFVLSPSRRSAHCQN